MNFSRSWETCFTISMLANCQRTSSGEIVFHTSYAPCRAAPTQKVVSIWDARVGRKSCSRQYFPDLSNTPLVPAVRFRGRGGTQPRSQKDSIKQRGHCVKISRSTAVIFWLASESVKDFREQDEMFDVSSLCMNQVWSPNLRGSWWRGPSSSCQWYLIWMCLALLCCIGSLSFAIAANGSDTRNATFMARGQSSSFMDSSTMTLISLSVEVVWGIRIADSVCNIVELA
jgi:hypothetical protein